MSLYNKCVYKKDKKGKWVCVKSEIEKCSSDVGCWERSNELESKLKLGERTFYTKQPTRSCVNHKVVQVRSYFGKDEKVIRNLITTSNKLPKGYPIKIAKENYKK